MVRYVKRTPPSAHNERYPKGNTISGVQGLATIGHRRFFLLRDYLQSRPVVTQEVTAKLILAAQCNLA